MPTPTALSWLTGSLTLKAEARANQAAPNPLRKRDARRFLREYWQQKPLLVRNALPQVIGLLTPDELAGLALEPEIESRIVQERGARGRWELRNGPFTEQDFAALPDTRWSLLVQAVDQYLPQVHELRRLFDFLPAWRFDDLMISYAADKGGVGPHFDQYDVFLIQAHGRRRWRIGPVCDESTPCRSDTALRILKRFETREEYLLEPGDMLYIPPGVSHWGIAEGECMTWSVGFRAPSHAEILDEVAAVAASRCSDSARFRDPPPGPARIGEIPPRAIRQLQQLLHTMADDRELVQDWFGRYMTERKYPELDIRPRSKPRTTLAAWLAQGGSLERNPASRFAWVAQPRPALYVDGKAHACTPLLAQLLCGAGQLDQSSLGKPLRSAATRALIEQLLAQGVLYRTR